MPAEEIATALYIATKLDGFKFHFNSERDLQQGIAIVLSSFLHLDWKPEVKLSRIDRIDFLVGKIGIEAKTGGSLAAVTRQLFRYAARPEISELVLVTTKASHRTLPNEINGKPLFVVYLLKSFL